MTQTRRRRRSTPTAVSKIEEFVASLAPSRASRDLPEGGELQPDADEETRRYVVELVYTATRLLGDKTPVADVKLLNAAMRELRYALLMFASHRDRRKVSTFGSARTPKGAPDYEQAKRFSSLVADAGYMVITGGGDGIMRACQEGAGRERSFGLNIRLPFEQRANDFIEGDPKLVTFRYFFTRKLLFVKEASAVVMFPGGFGTHDEGYEVMTLVQTGKAPLLPILFVDAPGGEFWKEGMKHLRDRLLEGKFISEEDLALFRVTDDAADAVAEIVRFYRVFHSARYVGDELILRLERAPDGDTLAGLAKDFADIVLRGTLRLSGPLPEEGTAVRPDLPRLVLHFNRINYGRLRKLIDALNLIP